MRLEVPEEFAAVSAAEDQKMKDKGKQVLEEHNDVEIDASETLNLLSIKQGTYNYLNITATPFKEMKKGEWKESNEQVKELIYLSFWEETKGAPMDTATTEVLIDSLAFEQFTLRIKVSPQFSITMCLLSRLHHGFDLGICYVYVDDKSRQAMEQVVRSTTFD